MAKTYGTVTTFTAGSVLTAAQLNVAGTAINNLVLPPSCQIRRTTNQTGYTSTAITWSSAAFDTDGMWSAGSPTILTIQTTGLYLVTLTGLTEATASLNRVLVTINKNGTSCFSQEAFGTTTQAYFSVSSTLSLVATDTLSAVVNYGGGSAYIIDGAATETSSQTRLTATWIGRTS
jgi:hypothetical protein